VAEAVVDVLEAVDVEEQHGDRRLVGAAQLGVDELVQVGPVGQLGEVVVPGLPGRRPLGDDPGGDVGVGDHDLPGLVDPGGLQVEPAGAHRGGEGVVEGDELALTAGQLAEPVEHAEVARVTGQAAGHPEVVAADADREPLVAEGLGGRPPRGVGQQHAALHVEQQRGRGQRIEHGLHDHGVAALCTVASPHVPRELPGG
jgi:hypothetical protein